MPTIGFLHTSPVHVATFDGLIDAVRPEVSTVHLVDEDLLARARTSGPDAVRAEVEAGLDSLRARGADVVVCTCSTLGGVAELVADDATVFRVDRPMARRAVATGSRIGVVAAVESTVVPTEALLADEARRAAADPTYEVVLVEDAWDLFEAGRTEDYLAQIAAAARELADRVDVVVLAQASMAPAAERLNLAVPVLASPGAAVAHALGLLDACGLS